MNSRKQAGFTAIFFILAVVLVGGIGYIGWYVWQERTLTRRSQAAAAKSSNPYFNWHLFVNDGNEYHFYYPPEWKVYYLGGGLPGSNASKPGYLLQSYGIGPSEKTQVVYVDELLAVAPTIDNVTLTHVHPGTEIVSSNPAEFGGVAVGHDVSKDAHGQYEDYLYWHNTIELHVSMDLRSDKTVFRNAADNRAYSPQLSMIARSVCFADKYKSGKCVVDK